MTGASDTTTPGMRLCVSACERCWNCPHSIPHTSPDRYGDHCGGWEYCGIPDKNVRCARIGAHA